MVRQIDRTFTWVIKDLSTLQSEKIYSDLFVIGGCTWRLTAYPKKQYWLNYLTLEVADSESFPIGWRRLANFSVTILNHACEKIYRRHVTQQWFDHKTPHLGFRLMQTTIGFLVREEVKIVTEIDVLQVIDKLDASEDTLSVKGSMHVNGFQVLPSQVKSVSRLFGRQPDIASKLRISNPLLKTAYMNLILSMIDTLRLPPQKISNGDLSDTETTLAYMKIVGFKLDWLEKKLGEIKDKKAKEKSGKIKIQNTEEKIKELKQKCSDLEAQLEIEKAEVLSATAPLLLSDDDDVF